MCFVIVGDVTSLATIPQEAEVEAHFLAKEDGVLAGIALAEMVFHEVDPTLKVRRLYICFLGLHGVFVYLVTCLVHFNKQVEWSLKDGDSVHKGLKLGKVYGKLRIKNVQ